MSPPTLSPPALHFLIVDFTITCGTNQLIFVAYTDTSCHLTLHMADVDPIIRKIPYQKRGANFTLSSVTCFVEIDTIDQDEAGDTTTHTFTIPLTAYDRWHYWYLTGTQGGAPMKSISQIFKALCHSPITPPQTVTIYSAPSAGGVSCDCQIDRHGPSQTWPSIHDGVQSLCWCSYLQLPCGYTTGGTWPKFTALYRIKITHDLIIVPVGSTILAVKYHFRLHTKQNTCGGAPSLCCYEITTPTKTGCGPADYQNCGTTPISNQIPWLDLTPGAWHQFDILPAYYSLFVPGLKSAFSIREATWDGPNLGPPWVNFCHNLFQIHSVDVVGAGSDPYLEITYQPP